MILAPEVEARVREIIDARGCRRLRRPASDLAYLRAHLGPWLEDRWPDWREPRTSEELERLELERARIWREARELLALRPRRRQAAS